MKLPSPSTIRWTPKQKALVVAAVRCGELTEMQACDMYRISGDELHIWMDNETRGGRPALRVTKIQAYAVAFAA